MSETPKYGLYMFLKKPPFQAATKLPTLPALEEFFLLGSKNNRNCPPLSTLPIHHDTPRLHQQAFLPPMARTHANALDRGHATPHGTATSPFESFSC